MVRKIAAKTDDRFDLDVPAAGLAAEMKWAFETDADKKKVYIELADKTYQFMTKYNTSKDDQKQKEIIKALELKLAELQAEKDKDQKGKPVKRKETGIARFMVKKETDKDDNEEEVEDEQSEESEGENPILADLARPKGAKKFFRKACPKGPKPKDVDNFMKTLGFKPAALAKVEEKAARKYKEFMNLPVSQRTGVKEMGADWGITIDLCNKLEAKQIIRLCTGAKES